MPEKCSWFSLYLLEGNGAWTKTQSGEKYKQLKQLRRQWQIPCLLPRLQAPVR